MDNLPESPAITQLIARWQQGEPGSESVLFEALYSRLRQVAGDLLRNEPPGVMSPTSLVHSAYLRMKRTDRIEIADRKHFIRLAAKVMRQIVVDKARRRRALKRDGIMASEDELDRLVTTDADADEILAVDLGLQDLEKRSERLAQLVELHHFGGYSFEELAPVMDRSARQLRRDWDVAVVRLRIAIDGTLDSPGTGPSA